MVDGVRHHTTQLIELAQEDLVFGCISAPGDLVLERHPLQSVTGRDLVAGIEQSAGCALADLDFSLDHRNAGALEPVSDREDRALDRDPAVRGVYEQTSVMLFGGVDDDIAACEIDGGATARGMELELAALVHLDHRAVGKLECRARVLGGANHLA